MGDLSAPVALPSVLHHVDLQLAHVVDDHLYVTLGDESPDGPLHRAAVEL